MYQRILVTTDGSELSDQAVAHALKLANALCAELLALRVVAPYPKTYFEGGVALAEEEVRRIEQQWHDDAMDSLHAIQAEGQKLGVKVRPLTVQSELIAEAIMAAAQQHKADLIIMASHGRRGLKRLLLGSETQQVLTHTSTPVLVLR
ncbi:MAG: universal stress protein [Pseudomonadota bacterium]|jgi:nucleotide-binding universal stress UspA family protein